MKTKITKKKFYNKFDYKITLRIDGCEILRQTSIHECKKNLENGIYPRFYVSERSKLNILNNKSLLIDICDSLLKYDVCSWQKRIEKGTIDIYSNDESIINELETKFYNNVSSIFKPSGEITEPNTLKVKKLPQGIYKYRVYLLPHRLKDEIDEKKKYLTWIKNQAGKIKLTECVERWFINTEWNWDPRYVLVDEESTLLMLKLRNPETIGRIYRFVTD